MRRFIYISLTILIAVSCSKIARTNKKLFGEWKIYSHRQTNSLGLTEYFETTGTITFGAIEGNEKQFTYSENYSYYDGATLVEMNRTGIGTYVDDEGEYYDLTVTSPSPALYEKSRIILITKDDLKLEQRSQGGTDLFVLQKD